MTLFTDLYELTMAQAYYAERMNDLAVFEDFSVAEETQFPLWQDREP